MGWLSALGSIFSAIASALGLMNKAADAAKTSSDKDTGAQLQTGISAGTSLTEATQARASDDAIATMSDDELAARESARLRRIHASAASP